ncbi:MAG: F390 synthetase-related protein [Clostridia bacterium]
MKIMTFVRAYVQAKYGRRFRTREQLERWQSKQVQRYLAWMLPRSPFYRSYYKGLDVSCWQSFPMIDKQQMMEHFDQLNTVGIEKAAAFEVALMAEQTRDFSPTINGITIGLSSGTSGNRGIFLVSEQERMMWAATILAKALPGSLFARQRIAFFLRANSNLYDSVKSRRISFRFFDLMETAASHIQRLNEYKPTLLVAPPSMLRLLSEAVEKGSLRIKPDRIISVAEVLDPLDEAYIGRQFRQTVHQIYQCTEGFLATTCEHGTLHLNEDLLVIQKEYLDEHRKKFVPIITDFSRTTQPIIRYRLNDILTERREPCPCGSVFTALASIEGRCDDLFYLPSTIDYKLVPVFPDFIRRAVIAASPAVEEYRVIQNSPTELTVMLRCVSAEQGAVQAEVAGSLQAMLESLGLQQPEIRFAPYDFQPGVTKLRRVERRFSVEGCEVV